MDDNREIGRHKPDMYKAAAQTQWLMQHQPSMKQIMSIIAERDAAIQERNMAINEKNKALEERNLAVLERDAAIHQKNEALAERDHALAALQYRENHINGAGCLNNGGSSSSCPPSIVKQEEQNPHQLIHQHHEQHQLDYSSKISFEPVLLREAAAPVSAISVTDNGKQNPKTKRSKDTKDGTGANKRTSTTKRKVKREDDDGEQQGIDNNAPTALKSNWKGPDLGLNQVAFDDSTMPSPVCSCTGVYRQCYKWGNGGWQSACCTTTMSMYPLPAVLGKKHARIGGRKMSGGAFSKLLSRLAAEGQDLTNPVDLKEHWAKHGTNRYITIK